MSTDQELESVKREPWKLKGITLYTKPRGKPNQILDVNDEGITVTAKSIRVVDWPKVLHGYDALRKNKVLDNKERGKCRPFSYRGAFVKPLLAILTTVEWDDQIKSPPPLRYVENRLPPRLRSEYTK